MHPTVTEPIRQRTHIGIRLISINSVDVFSAEFTGCNGRAIEGAISIPRTHRFMQGFCVRKEFLVRLSRTTVVDENGLVAGDHMVGVEVVDGEV
ncbi:hypothetical protein [Thermostaphylospora chromogena]|uniref:hypothetical protein n=1 Tax=Thermostaphylospora chromogena TaxID=35622 RepID=UPI001042255C|nr:hypothetical protein [Thermostaphylospora chromogena]